LSAAELLNQYSTPLWISDGKIIYLSPEESKLVPKRYSLGDMVIHAAADPVTKPDVERVTHFMKAVHEQAERSIGGVERLGYLQMSVLVPDSKGMVPTKSAPSTSV
jgi:hypothetical protein